MAKYMITWHIRPEHYSEALQRFADTGAPAPEGVNLLGRWHEPGSARGFILVEAQDLAGVAKHLSGWNDLVEHQTVPVLEDDELPPRA